MDGKKYPVGTLAEMAAIPESARPRFLAEFPDLLAEYAGALELLKLLPGGVMELGTPTWVDDDKGTKTYTARTPDGEMIASLSMPIKPEREA